MESIVENIGRMLNRKMDAAKCIANKSSEHAYEFHQRNFQNMTYIEQNETSYYSSKFSKVSLNLLTINLFYNKTLIRR
jgi:hypothetical protein